MKVHSSAARSLRVRWSVLCTPGMGANYWG